MKGNASLFAAVDLGSNAFRMTIGQQVLNKQQLVMQKVKTLREPVRLAEGLRDDALDMREGFRSTRIEHNDAALLAMALAELLNKRISNRAFSIVGQTAFANEALGVACRLSNPAIEQG